MENSDAAVHLRHACKTYGNGPSLKTVLSNLNMDVPKGSIYGLLGSSGCGKTTILGCIAGRLKLDSGELQVLGGEPGTKRNGIPGPRIGYMPQETSLVCEMTTKNLIYYFGWMFSMRSPEIAERLEFLSKLLDLPPDDRLIRVLSGGQQRRVSLAAALVQTPELLLLDEPTVGLDPVLRQSIWDYMMEITRDRCTTIVITTHYIEEATQAHKIGFLRDGILLADASPVSIISHYNCTTLEEAFLLLSEQQGAIKGELEKTFVEDVSLSAVAENETIVEAVCANQGLVFDGPIIGAQKPIMKRPEASSRSRMKALLYKDSLTISRNYVGLVFLFLIPVIQIPLFFVTTGNDGHYLPLGIVNDEYPNCREMIADVRNSSGVTLREEDEYVSCHYHGLSCLFIDKLESTTTVRLFHYENKETALAASKRNSNQALVYFPGNFSVMLERRHNDPSLDDAEVLEGSEIKAWVDMSDYLIGYQLKKFLYDTYAAFSESISDGCKENKKTFKLPVKFFDPVYGSNQQSYRESMAPGFILIVVYTLSATVTATALTSERVNGLWDRNLVAGATILEIILSHVLCSLVAVIIQISEILLMTFVVINLECKGSWASVIVMMSMQSLAGIAYGIFVSAISNTSMEAIFFTLGIFFPYSLFVGLLWPVRALPPALRYFGYLSPVTLASTGFGDVLVKGFGLWNAAVLPGILIPLLWIIVHYGLAIVVLRRK